VLVERRFTHPLLKKTVRRTKKYHAHDENNNTRLATSFDRGMPPISKNKRLDKVTDEEYRLGSVARGRCAD
jgi:small subunit ribosomal protein S17